MLTVEQMRQLSQEPPRDEDYRCGHALLEAANEIARLRAAVLSVVTPENVALGHTWLKRKIIEALEQSE